MLFFWKGNRIVVKGGMGRPVVIDVRFGLQRSAYARESRSRCEADKIIIRAVHRVRLYLSCYLESSSNLTNKFAPSLYYL